MRKTASVLAVSVLVPLLLALPTYTPPAPRPHAVAPSVENVALTGVDSGALAATKQPAARSDGRRPAARPTVLTPERATRPFQVLGVTWDHKAAAEGAVAVWVRTKTKGQARWTDWTQLDGESDDGPDAGSPDLKGADVRDGTAPVWAGPSDAVQVRVDAAGGVAPRGLRIDLVDPGTSAADAFPAGRQPGSTAAAAAAQPTVLSRRQWGADESLRTAPPSYATTIKAGFVHHTVNTNTYSSGDVPAIIRGIYAFHVLSRGWSDIGYNFLVDRFGRLWEGRYGGIARHVIGAHTGGFNSSSFGVSAIGDFTKVAPTSAMLTAIARLEAWKLQMYHADPLGTAKLYSGGSPNSRYPAGTIATFNVISGHRDAAFTSCPGGFLYAKLSTIRSLTVRFMGAAVTNPARSPSWGYGSKGTGTTVSAGVIGPQSYQIDVRRACDGLLLRRLTGTASRSAPIRAHWDQRSARGVLVNPGTYTLTLTSTNTITGAAAVPWRTTFDVLSDDPVPPVPTGAQPARSVSTFVPLPPTRLLDTKVAVGSPLGLGARDRLDLQVTGVGGVPATGVTAVSLDVGAWCPTRRNALFVYPAGATGSASTIGVKVSPYTAGRSAVVAPVGVGGKVSIGTYDGETQLSVSVTGYWTASPAASRYTPMSPHSVYTSLATTKFAPGEIRSVAMTGATGVPADATAVVVNLLGYQAAAGTTFSAWPTGAAGPTVPQLEVLSDGRTTVNRVVLKLGRGGAVSFRNGTGAAHLNVEIVGYYSVATTGQRFTPVSPTAVVDSGAGLGTTRAPWAAGQSRVVTVAGVGGVPPDARTVALQVTAPDPVGNTALIVAPAGVTSWPAIADLAPRAGVPASNLVVVPVGSGGQISVRNTTAATNLRMSVVGWFG